MAWKLRTTCQQCNRKLNADDRKLGTVCAKCAHDNKSKVYGNDADDIYEDGE
jgi:hypothetical protein